MLGTGMNIGIYESDRREIAAQLAVLLADTYVLYLKTQNFHWNVTGKMFGALHLLFEQQYKQLSESIDEIAECIRSLGFAVPATLGDFQKRTSLRDSNGFPKAKEMILELIEAHEVLIETSRVVLEFSESVDDIGTSDLAVKRIQFHEKCAWMLRSYLDD
jgi:starvation-inducible DNA-binding protein